LRRAAERSPFGAGGMPRAAGAARLTSTAQPCAAGRVRLLASSAARCKEALKGRAIRSSVA